MSPYNHRVLRAALAVLRGQTYGSPSLDFIVPKLQLFIKLEWKLGQQNGPVGKQSRHAVLTEMEDDLAVKHLSRYSERRIPLYRNHLRDAIAVVVTIIVCLRRILVTFENGNPVPKCLQRFSMPHEQNLTFGSFVKQESLRFRMWSVQTLTIHLAPVSKLMYENNTDPKKI